MQHKTRDILLGGLLVVLALTVKVQGQQFERAINALDGAIANKDAISLPLYIEGCRSLQGLIRRFGKLFAFCDGQFGNMVDNLEQAGLAANGERLPAYNSIQSAIEFEIEHGLVRSEKPSAARGVADLQWALRWLSNFMQKLSVMGDKGDTASAAKKAYSEVFGKKHAWMIKTIVGFGLRTLPKKKTLIQRIFSDEDSSAEQRNEKIAKFARITEELISVLDKFYAEKNLQRM